MYKLILYAVLFLILVIIVGFLLARRKSRADNLRYATPKRKTGGLVRKLTSDMPKFAKAKPQSTNGNMIRYKLLSSIEFLTDYSRKASNVVFIGAEPGTHLIFLRHLFPDHKFFIKGKKLNPKLKDVPGTIVIDDMKDVPQDGCLSKDGCLFISYLEPNEKNLKQVKDMVKQLSPKMTSIRFRPWNSMEYFRGDLHIPPWISGSDTQLITKGKSTKTYHTEDYIARLAFFNERIKLYGYDEQAEEFIIDRFSQTIGHKWIKEKIQAELDRFIRVME